MKRYCFTLDLVNDPLLIEQYDTWHKKDRIWPEIPAGIRASGVSSMQIYRLGTRLCMVMETSDTFDLLQKSREDAVNPRVQEWEQLMWQYQQALPGSQAGAGAHRVTTVPEIMADPWVIAHGLSLVREHEGVGLMTTNGPGQRLSRTPAVPGAPASIPGADARSVFAQYGLEDHFENLVAAGVLRIEGP